MSHDLTPTIQSRDVIFKLLAFTVAMILAPLGTYFGTVHTLFSGTYAPPQ